MASPKIISIHSIIYTVCLYFLVSQAQGAFPVDASATPPDVPVGNTVNLTCLFGLDKNTLKEAQFSFGGNALFSFSAADTAKPPGVEDFGAAVADDAAATNTTIWATVKVSLCTDKSTERTFECKATNQADETADDTVDITVSGDPSSENCDPASSGSNGTDTTAADYSTPPPTPKGNATSDGLDYENIAMYGSAIALIIILITAAILGLIGLWYCMLVKQGRARPPSVK